MTSYQRGVIDGLHMAMDDKYKTPEAVVRLKYKALCDDHSKVVYELDEALQALKLCLWSFKCEAYKDKSKVGPEVLRVLRKHGYEK